MYLQPWSVMRWFRGVPQYRQATKPILSAAGSKGDAAKAVTVGLGDGTRDEDGRDGVDGGGGNDDE
jgi:hypothetical protein